MQQEIVKKILKESSDIENIHLLDEGIIIKNGICKCDYCNKEMPMKLYTQCPNCKRHASIY